MAEVCGAWKIVEKDSDLIGLSIWKVDERIKNSLDEISCFKVFRKRVESVEFIICLIFFHALSPILKNRF